MDRNKVAGELLKVAKSLVAGYQGVAVAESGVLLGGVKVHKSSPFDSKRDAEKWLDVVIETNKEAGRKIDMTKSKVVKAG